MSALPSPARGSRTMLSFPRCHTREPDKARVGSPPGGSRLSAPRPLVGQEHPGHRPGDALGQVQDGQVTKTADMRSPAGSDGGNGALDVFGQCVDEATLVGPHHLVGDA